jgi:hypothetical protein
MNEDFSDLNGFSPGRAIPRRGIAVDTALIDTIQSDKNNSDVLYYLQYWKTKG